ncbi:MAG: general secretion pathway protein GspB [Thermodesulfobacteriota bacterium]|jgi:general secretion pathway protein B
MSYILEGLKKLEQKRRQEEGAPDLLTFKEEQTLKPERPIIWLYLILFALLLNAGVILWWIGPWRSIERSALPHPTVLGRTVKTVAATPGENKKQSTPVPNKELQPPKVINEFPKSPTVGKTKENVAPVVKKTPAPKSTPGVVTVSPESQSLAISKVVPEGRIVKLSDLPPEIKKSLPALKMSVHFYSPDKKARFVTINDRILHEGEALSDGLRVVEINPDGTVLHYRGHRFLVSVNDNF